MKKVFLTLWILGMCPILFGQRYINITTTPSDAAIYNYATGRYGSLLGRGSCRLKLDRKSQNRIALVREGYETRTFSFPKKKPKYPETVHITLDTRVVKVTASPYDARMYANGVHQSGQTAVVSIPPGQTVTLELKKRGFKTISRTFQNREGGSIPPIDAQIELTDRLVQVIGSSDTHFYAAEQLLGKGNAEVFVPKGQCTSITIKREGFATEERTYCYKDGLPTPPVNETFTLKDRIIEINTTPENAEIKVDGLSVGFGNYSVIVPEGESIEVIVKKDGFVPIKKAYHNRHRSTIPLSEHYALKVDEAFTASVSSDQANVNFAITIGKGKSEDEAWRTLSQIVMNKFDLIELSDKATGYLRTAYQVKRFESSTVRTRIIVKMNSYEPLRYTIKIVSEYSFGHPSIKDDEAFKEWDRILKTYKNIIEEAHARLN